MSDPRFARRTVVTRRPHDCAWCPDRIAVGIEAETWTWPTGTGHGYAHRLCEQIACAEVGEAFGDDDHLLGEPDREGTLRTLSFIDSEEEARMVAVREEHPEDAERMAVLWRHPRVQGWREVAAQREVGWRAKREAAP